MRIVTGKTWLAATLLLGVANGRDSGFQLKFPQHHPIAVIDAPEWTDDGASADGKEHIFHWTSSTKISSISLYSLNGTEQVIDTDGTQSKGGATSEKHTTRPIATSTSRDDPRQVNPDATLTASSHTMLGGFVTLPGVARRRSDNDIISCKLAAS